MKSDYSKRENKFEKEERKDIQRHAETRSH